MRRCRLPETTGLHEPALALARALSSFGVMKASGDLDDILLKDTTTAMGPDHVR